MIDFETIRTMVLITLIAIAAKIIKMQATRQFIPPS